MSTSLNFCVDVDGAQTQLLVLVEHAPRGLAVQPANFCAFVSVYKKNRVACMVFDH